ncbi:YMGG-like glycine zipper-containing protein [Caballeronia sp. LZ035]|uniref:YMGG-like glycine zipper-containing protein n=1 Tax=Caballeronia sp. LZ035 TaxID=3038568 RepID=UPI002857DDD6|nr:YMGG-like glycine zipper-containing protein [Caballeronia sp. LZ035]MDR5759868.1 glycine zipper family protein [Caballeronia sp. LZ035]
MNITRLALLSAALGLSACTVMPTGPSVMALPGSNKTFDQFRADDASCRQFALQQTGGVDANQAATNSAVGSAVVGTALGAAAGAAFGGGSGAAIGAGAGLLAGSAFGLGASQTSGYNVQQRYDYSYLQCMYAAGDRVPVRGAVRTIQQQPAGAAYTTPPPPPPPPGWQPPPGSY